MSNKTSFYSCKYDRVFKEVFLNPSNIDILKEFLEFTLETKIDDIKTSNTELFNGNSNIKGKTTDILVRTGNKIVNIEINSHNKSYIKVRNASYACNLYHSNYLTGDEYTSSKNVIQINISWQLGVNAEKVDRYKLSSVKHFCKLFVDNLEIIEINMGYFMKVWYDKNEKEIDKYMYYIILGLNQKELCKLKTDNKFINKVKEEVIKVNNDPEFIEFMTKERDDMMIRNSLISEAKEEGMNKGLRKGLKQSKLEIAKNMLNENIDINIVSKVTGLSIKEINKLKD